MRGTCEPSLLTWPPLPPREISNDACSAPDSAPPQIGWAISAWLMRSVVFHLHVPLSRASQTLGRGIANGSKDITRSGHSRRTRCRGSQHSTRADARLGPVVVGASRFGSVRRGRLPDLGPARAPAHAQRWAPGGVVVNAMLDLRHEGRRLRVSPRARAVLDGAV